MIASTVGTAGRSWMMLLLAGVFLLPLVASRKFLASAQNKYAAKFETITGLWVASVYLMLGAAPMFLR